MHTCGMYGIILTNYQLLVGDNFILPSSSVMPVYKHLNLLFVPILSVCLVQAVAFCQWTQFLWWPPKLCWQCGQYWMTLGELRLLGANTYNSMVPLHIGGGREKMALIFTDNVFKCIFFEENFSILTQTSLKSVPKSSVDKKSSL